MDKKIKYWVEISEYDLKTAEAMLKTERFLYVGFMCHQAIEKITKAFYQMAKTQIPPKAHNLVFLAQESGLYLLLSEKHKAFLEILQPMNIETRYPEHRERIFKLLDNQRCLEILRKTQELHQWIKEKLK